MQTSHAAAKTAYRGSNKLLLGIVLAVLTFWLFAGSLVNVVPAMQRDLRIPTGLIGVAISFTALFSGISIVVAGGLADRYGRMRVTYVGLGLNILGSLCLVLTPSGTAALLIVGRIIQGISAACIMPATLSLVKAYYDGAARQRAISFWSIGSWGGLGRFLVRGRRNRDLAGLALDICVFHCRDVDQCRADRGNTREQNGIP